MSFHRTAEQMANGSKDVTRRVSSKRPLQVGEIFQPVRQMQGLKRGQTYERLGGPRQVRQADRVPLDGPTLTADDVRREGFPGQSPAWFVAMFCRLNGCAPDTLVWRYEFLERKE